ncbi:MAG: CNNM domain-containing protein [Chthoniobacterales bacterium]
MMTVFLILCLWTVSFCFAGIEAGLLSIDPVRLRNRVKRRNRGALRLNALLRTPERLLVTVLLVTNMADIVALLLLTRSCVRAFGYAGFGVAILLAFPIYVFVLGVLPKSLFRRFPFRALAALAGVLDAVSFVLWPVLELGALAGRILQPARSAKRPRLFAAREELKQIAEQSEREGSLTSTERAMIHNVVDFRHVRARDVMVPVAQAVAVKPETPVSEVLKLSAATGVDRIPVLAEGRAIGLINVYDILFDRMPAWPLQRYTRRIVVASENEPAYRLIQRLRAARLSLAAVVDGERKLVGLAVAEDMIKRLVQSA